MIHFLSRGAICHLFVLSAKKPNEGNSSRRLERGKNSQILWMNICKVGCKYNFIAPDHYFLSLLDKEKLAGSWDLLSSFYGPLLSK